MEVPGLPVISDWPAARGQKSAGVVAHPPLIPAEARDRTAFTPFIRQHFASWSMPALLSRCTSINIERVTTSTATITKIRASGKARLRRAGRSAGKSLQEAQKSMSEIAHIVATIFRRAANARRFIVALAGPPAAGKSTAALELAALFPRDTAAVVGMDGFHYDDAVLAGFGLSERKGAPETFDVDGLESLLVRLRAADRDVAIPVFDRTMELARAAAVIVRRETKFLIVEGNYLLLDEQPWSRLAPLFDFTVFLDVPRDEIERRLVARWHEHGRSQEAARRWIDTNDMPNAERILARRRKSDVIWGSEPKPSIDGCMTERSS